MKVVQPAPFDLKGKKVWIAGHLGMMGRALMRRLREEPCDLLYADRQELDLRDQAAVNEWAAQNNPDAVVIAAATVGGIHANQSRPYEFLFNNLAIESNIIEAARTVGVGRLLFLGSSCMYPKFANQPMAEEALLTGALEPTNRWYALAKLAGTMLAEAATLQHGLSTVTAIPTNLYGPFDNFDLESGHVVAALMRKIHEAKIWGRSPVEIWGSGRPMREFLYVDDCADACVFLLVSDRAGEALNVGSGEEISIHDLAAMIAEIVGYSGQFEFNVEKPDGTPRKLVSTERLSALGWSPQITLWTGLETTYRWFRENAADNAGAG